MPLAAIMGCEGTRLTARERAFFRASAPWGFILFARNVESPAQVGALCAELREVAGHDAPILIDQEGGRVARLKAPHWREWEPVRALATREDMDEDARREALALRYEMIGAELLAVGIDVNCAPLADVPVAGAHDIIGDRALGASAADVAPRARAVAEGLLAAGVLPVLKHVPGHGRATVDSHEHLPRVDTPLAELRETCFAPFRDLADCAMAMTAHVVFEALDPDRCATHSPAAIRMIREELGLDGLLMSDDLGMKALKGGFGRRAMEVFAAGCDVVLHCSGDMDEMEEVAGCCPSLAGEARRRADAALAQRGGSRGRTLDEMAHAFAALTREAAHA